MIYLSGTLTIYLLLQEVAVICPHTFVKATAHSRSINASDLKINKKTVIYITVRLWILKNPVSEICTQDIYISKINLLGVLILRKIFQNIRYIYIYISPRHSWWNCLINYIKSNLPKINDYHIFKTPSTQKQQQAFQNL